MKQELINKIGPNCLLPFSFMVLWVDNLLFNNDPNGAIKLEVKNRVRSDGRLDTEGWNILIHNVTFEQNSPVNGNVILNWIYSQGSPTCNQLKIIIQSLKLGTISQLFVEYPVLDILEINMKTKPLYSNGNGGKILNWQQRQGKLAIHDDPDGPQQATQPIRVKFLTLYINNFDYIKDCSPYLVIERYTGSKKKSNRKSGWKRDKVLKNLNGEYPLWGGGSRQITYNDGYRPNNIPILSAVQEFDIYAENYIKIGSMDNYIPQGVGQNYDRNVSRGGANSIAAKVSLRFRIGIKSGGKEILSKPLLNFTIFAQKLANDKTIYVGYSKI